MKKTDFKSDDESLLAWLRNVKITDPMPRDAAWRMMLILRYLDTRLRIHEEALMAAYADAVQVKHPSGCLCDECFAKLTPEQQAAIEADVPHPIHSKAGESQ